MPENRGIPLDGRQAHPGLATSGELRATIEAGGFETVEWVDETAWVLGWFDTVGAEIAAGEAKPPARAADRRPDAHPELRGRPRHGRPDRPPRVLHPRRVVAAEQHSRIPDYRRTSDVQPLIRVTTLPPCRSGPQSNRP
ncbi:hypothetical protein ACU686_25455 [Yinghuangia aomiensis]